MNDTTTMPNEADDSKLLRWWGAVLLMAITVSFAYVFATDIPEPGEAPAFGAAWAATTEAPQATFHQQYGVKTAEAAEHIEAF